MTDKLFVIRKGGYYYRPHARGYTGSLHEAGRYPEAEAVAHMMACDPGEITIFPAPVISASTSVQDDIRITAEKIVLEHVASSTLDMDNLATAIAAALEEERAKPGNPPPQPNLVPFSQPRCQCEFPIIKYGGKTVACDHCGLPPGRAPAPEKHVEGWQDISTAPKNTKVLAAYRNELGNWRIVTACYHTELPWSDEYGDHEEEFAPEAWYEESDSSEVIYQTSRQPTHWQPLPAPPATTEGSDNG